MEPVAADGRLGILLSSLTESLDFVLMTMVETLELRTEDAIDLLTLITGDRGQVLERIRQEYLRDETGASAVERSVLLQTTSVFERAIWIMQRLARLLGRSAAKRDQAELTDPAPAVDMTLELSASARAAGKG
jgi:hypothetical protein